MSHHVKLSGHTGPDLKLPGNTQPTLPPALAEAVRRLVETAKQASPHVGISIVRDSLDEAAEAVVREIGEAQ